MLNTILSGDMTSIILSTFSLLIVLFVCFPVHECAHATVAKWLGDDTAERQGRVTLNPFAHLDILGTIGLILFGIGWAKPVPVQPYRCRKIRSQKAAMALTAAAGPISNILISLIFMIIWKILIVTGALVSIPYLSYIMNMVITTNLYLAVFNLLPIPPFDGSRIFLAFLPQKYYFSIMKYEQIIMLVILGLLWTGILDIPFMFLSNGLYSFLNLITGFIC
ncbi:MAG: site-2 protease family protein [Ruminiclostridium sp.]